MYHVQFPKMGLNFDINNQIHVGNLSIYWYGIIIAVGLILAVLYGMANARRLGVSADKLLNCVIVGVITGIVGARAYYVLFQWEYYSAHIDKILAVNEGGLAIYGGIIGALIGGLIVARIDKMDIPALLDVAAVGFLIGQGIGRWGNFFNQEAYGVPTELPWGMMSEGTDNIAVHPCFLYESVWCLLGVLVLHLFSKSKARKYHGQMALLYMVWYGVERTVVEGLRTDSLYIPNTSLRVSQMVSIFIALLGIGMLILLKTKNYQRIMPAGSEEIKINKFKKPVYSIEKNVDDNAKEISSHSLTIDLPVDEKEVSTEETEKSDNEENITEATEVAKTDKSENKREKLDITAESEETAETEPSEQTSEEKAEEFFDINSVIEDDTEAKDVRPTKKAKKKSRK